MKILKPPDAMKIDQRFKNDPLYRSLFQTISCVAQVYYKKVSLGTFQDLQNYKFTSQPVIITILDDQGDGKSSYIWDGSLPLLYNVGVDSVFQPTIN